MIKRISLLAICICSLALVPMVFSKVPIPDSVEQCLKVEGKVIDIIDAGSYDIRFIIEGDHSIYYINRGLERGLNLDELKNKLIGKTATFYYPEHFSILDPNNNSRHLNQVNFQDEIIFTEIGF